MKTTTFAFVLLATFSAYADVYSEIPEREVLSLGEVHLFDGRAIPLTEADGIYLYKGSIDYIEVDGEIIDRADIVGLWLMDGEYIEARMPAGSGGHLEDVKTARKDNPRPQYPAGFGGVKEVDI